MEDELHTRTYTVAMNRLEWPGYEIKIQLQTQTEGQKKSDGPTNMRERETGGKTY